MTRILSCFSNSFGPLGVWTAAENLRATGLTHLELALRGHNFGGLIIPEESVVTEKADDATAQRFVEHLAANQASVSGCNVGGANLLTDEGLAITCNRIQFAAKWFQVKICVTGAGQPASAEEWSVISKNLNTIGKTAADCGITMALETHKGPTQNAASMLRTLEAVNHPSVLLNFDTGNIAYYNEGMTPMDELKKVAHLVVNVHVKDNRGRLEDWYFPALGEGGAVDFTSIRETLDAQNYKGAYTVELEGIGGEPEPGLEERVNRLRKSYEWLKTCGY
jgi:inosose dehydratase